MDQKQLEDGQTWHQKNREKIREQQRRYYEKNRERLNAKAREYREAHREELRKKARERYQKSRQWNSGVYTNPIKDQNQILYDKEEAHRKYLELMADPTYQKQRKKMLFHRENDPSEAARRRYYLATKQMLQKSKQMIEEETSMEIKPIPETKKAVKKSIPQRPKPPKEVGITKRLHYDEECNILYHKDESGQIWFRFRDVVYIFRYWTGAPQVKMLREVTTIEKMKIVSRVVSYNTLMMINLQNAIDLCDYALNTPKLAHHQHYFAEFKEWCKKIESNELNEKAC